MRNFFLPSRPLARLSFPPPPKKKARECLRLPPEGTLFIIELKVGGGRGRGENTLLPPPPRSLKSSHFFEEEKRTVGDGKAEIKLEEVGQSSFKSYGNNNSTRRRRE